MGKGTWTARFRIDEGIWDDFGKLCDRYQCDRSEMLREAVMYLVSSEGVGPDGQDDIFLTELARRVREQRALRAQAMRDSGEANRYGKVMYGERAKALGLWDR